jgi:uncharacterized protein (TIGR02996 family)
MWKPMRVMTGELTGRVRAVSLPVGGRVAVWTEDGYYTLDYGWAIRVTRARPQWRRRFDSATGVFRLWQAFDMYGMWEAGGQSRTRLPDPHADHPAGERLEPNPDADELVVYEPTGAVSLRVPDFHHRSEPWAVAAFREDGQVLLVADPTGVRLFRFFPTRRPANAAWQASGNRAERDALMAAVCGDPDDDTLRMVYADWLEEHGDADRAEFIRLQCSLIRDTPRERELWHRYGSRWAAEMPVIPGIRWSGFVRGFPQVSVGSGATLTKVATAAWAASPVEQVTLTVLSLNSARMFAGSPYLTRVRHLILCDRRFQDGDLDALVVLLNSPHLGGLRRLDWEQHRAPDRAVGLVAGCPRLAGLEELTVASERVGRDAVLAVARSAHLRNVRRFWVRSQRFGPVAAAELKARFPEQKWR